MEYATLIELIGNNLKNPKYQFNYYKNFKKDSICPNLFFFSYNEKNSINEKKVKEISLITLNKNNILDDRIYGNYSNIEELQEKMIKNEKELEKYKLKNFHKFWKKENWKNEDLITRIYDIASSAGLAASFFNPLFFTIPGCSQPLLEVMRKFREKTYKKELNNLQEEKQIYNNFKSNIENAKIEIYFPSEAQEIIYEIEQFKTSFKYASVFDVKTANQDLKKIYSKY